MSDALTKSETHGEFSVWWQDLQGRNYPEKRFCGPEEAVRTAASLTNRPAAKMGLIKDVKITDGGEFCAWHWRDGVIVFDGHSEVKDA